LNSLTYGAAYRRESDGKCNKSKVPIVPVLDSSPTQEHEEDCLQGTVKRTLTYDAV
jgi:hypothetical protein